MRAWLCGRAAIALMAPTASRAQSVLIQPDWLRRPDPAALGAAYPKAAAALQIDGRATISCSVDDMGVLQGCRSESESPAGLGFAAAALSLAPTFLMRPLSKDGRPVSGGSVRIPLRFVSPRAELTSPPTPTAPLSDDKLDLARQFVDLGQVLSRPRDLIYRQILDIQGTPAEDGVSRETREAAAAALQAAWLARAAEYRDAIATIFAEGMSEAELRAGLSIPWTSELAAKTRALQSLAQPMGRRYRQVVIDDARREFCRSRDCAAP